MNFSGTGASALAHSQETKAVSLVNACDRKRAYILMQPLFAGQTELAEQVNAPVVLSLKVLSPKVLSLEVVKLAAKQYLNYYSGSMLVHVASV